MLRIVTDSAGDVPSDWLEEYQIHVIPVNIHFGEKQYLQGVDLSDLEFYQLAETSGVVPKTSQPTPHQFIEFYRRIAAPGDQILSIHVTSKLSGTYHSAELATRELAQEFEIYPFDSMAGSVAQGFMCKEARNLDRQGASLEDIMARLDFIRGQVEVILCLDSLEFARMSGRVQTLQAALASLLNIKPIISLEDGVLDVTGRVRTRGKALQQVVSSIAERFGDKPLHVAVVHALDPGAGEKVMADCQARLNCQEIILTDLSIGVAANLGPGTIGVIAYPAS